MTRIFDIDGNNLDQGFVNIRSQQSQAEREMYNLIEEMWGTYESYADPDFRHGFARDVDGRFWEMYMGCTLLEAGRALLPAAERLQQAGQPDLCVVEDGRRIWIEAIASGMGEPGPDQIVPPLPLNEGGSFVPAPVRETQLRTTSSFWTKSRRIARYLQEGVIGANDVRIIAINASRFALYASEDPPLIMSSVFPIGDAYVTLDPETGDIIEHGFHAAPFIERDGDPIPRTAFLDERFADISGVLWSRIGLGNLSRQIRPLTYVHNPLAHRPLSERWGVWDREFVTRQHGENWQTTDILAHEPIAPGQPAE